jgi:hypothetical protein
MDVTEAVMQLAVALIGVLVPLIVAYVAFYVQKALKALEVKKYAEALREYDMALYDALAEAGRAAVAKARDEAEEFASSDIRPFLYRQAAEVSRSFSKKAGVRVDLNEQRVDALVELAVREAEEAWRYPKTV